MGALRKKFIIFSAMSEKAETFSVKNSYPDFLIIQTIPGKADNYRILSKKSRDNFFKKGRYQTAQMQMR